MRIIFGGKISLGNSRSHILYFQPNKPKVNFPKIEMYPKIFFNQGLILFYFQIGRIYYFNLIVTNYLSVNPTLLVKAHIGDFPVNLLCTR